MAIRPDRRASYLFLSEHTHPGDIFVDIGACEGLYTRLAADLVGETGRVYAIEPEQFNLAVLRENLRGYRNVTIEGCALSNFVGTALLHLGKSPGLHSIKEGLLGRDVGVEVVKVKRMDDFHWAAGNFINGVKIDVEGAELEVLAGGKWTLSDPLVTYIAVDVHPSLGVIVDRVADMLIGFGFELVAMPGQHNELFGIKEKL